MTTGNPYRYFVSYVFTRATGQGFGSSEMHQPAPIRGAADLQELQKRILEQDRTYSAVVILFYHRMEDDAS
jgi:hypothetical protein